MFDIDKWAEIFTSIKKNWLRTILSGFTVALGLFIFITLFGMGNGLKNSFMQEFLKGAANSMFIYADITDRPYNGLQQGRRIQFKNEDVEMIRDKFGDELQYITAASYGNPKVSYGNETGVYDLRAVDPERQLIEINVLQKGRFLNQTDIQNKAKVLVIGRLVEKDLFKNKNAVGNYLNLDGINYLIVGTFSDEGGDREERVIYEPITTFQQMNGSTQDVSEIILGYYPEKTSEAEVLGDEIEKYLKAKLQVHPEDKTGIFLRNDAKEAGGTFAFLFVIGIIVFVIGAGTLIAGMMGIFNIMVYSVKERTKELGIRKALGAPPNSIIFLVLTESVLITFFSGIVGIVVGVLFLNYLGDKLKDYFILNPSVDSSLIIFALFCLVFAGFIAGFIPARRGSKIKPIEALRDE